jgi:hypothetical protein
MTGQYDWTELLFNVEAVAASMTDGQKSALAFSASFRGPDGSTLTMPGFWAGGSTWKVRFAPTAHGDWTYRTACEQSGLDGLTGVITCDRSANPGFLKQDGKHPHHLIYSDDTPVYVWGNTAYYLLQERLEGHTDHWRQFIVKSREHGMNKIRFLVHMWDWGNIYGNRWYPWLHCTPEHPRFDAFHTAYWDALDEIVTFMQEQGVIAELIVFANYATSSQADLNEPGLYEMEQNDEERFVRYVAARYAAFSNVIWCLTNEWHYHVRKRFVSSANPKGTVPAQWVNRLASYLAKTDPYIAAENRLLSAHQKTTAHFSFKQEAWATHCSTQFGMRNIFDGVQYKYGHDWCNYQILINRDCNKPVFNDEYGYDGDAGEAGAAGADEKDRVSISMTREVSRACAWGIAVAGGYGTYGEKHKRQGSYLYSGYKNSIWFDYPSQDDIRVLTEFMQRVDYRSMKPDNGLVPVRPFDREGRANNKVFPYVLARPGSEYVLYLAQESGRPLGDLLLRVILKAGDYTAVWYDPASGETIGSEAQLSLEHGGEHVFEMPVMNYDLLLYVKRI